jgi:glycerophosphoryl diester phosphodiesterase
MKSYPDHPEYTPPPQRCAEMLLDAIQSRGVDSHAMVESFDFRVLRAMRRIAPEIPLAALIEDGDPDFVSVSREAEADMIAPEFHMVTAEKVAAAHAAGIGVVTWTVNDPADWQRLVDAGVDGIITDDPAALISWLPSATLYHD